jgi:hypothetical protein
MFDLTHVFCENAIGKPENPDCADTLWTYDPNSHMQYVGINLAYNWCTEPSATFLY